MPTYSKYIYTLSAAQQAALGRAFHCKGWEVEARLHLAFTGLLGELVGQGETGAEADRLIASGDLEVGRATPEAER